MRSGKWWILVLGAALLFGPAACDSDSSNNENTNPDVTTPTDTTGNQDVQTGNDMTGPTGHTESLNGVWHAPDKTDPLANCASCHGSDLKGGTGPSCHSCHNADDHTINQDGQMHRQGDSGTCNTCHGPNNAGGLGPACSSCHGK